MDHGNFQLSLLTEEHDLTSFNSTKPSLDEWFAKYALASQQADLARTYVLVRTTDTAKNTVIGYFSLTMNQVLRDEVPRKLVGGVPRYPIGCVLIARLALDKSAQGQGIGADLLRYALTFAVRAGDIAAARLVAVDALDEQAEMFYRRFGFISLPGAPRRLYRRIKDIRTSLEVTAGRQ